MLTPTILYMKNYIHENKTGNVSSDIFYESHRLSPFIHQHFHAFEFRLMLSCPQISSPTLETNLTYGPAHCLSCTFYNLCCCSSNVEFMELTHSEHDMGLICLSSARTGCVTLMTTDKH